MADIDQIIAGGAGSSSRADFSGIGKLADSYYKARDESAKNDLRTAFKDGVPLTPDGQPDFSAMAKTLFQKGGLSEGTAAAGLGLQQNKLRYGQDTDATIQGGQAQPQSNIISPSTSRGASVPDAPPRGAPVGQPQGAPQGGPQGGATVMKVLAAQGIPNDQLGAASASVARQLGIDPTAPLDLNDPQVRNVLGPAIAQLKRAGIGQVQPPQPGDNPPQGQQAPPQMPQAQPPQGVPQPPPQAVQQPQAQPPQVAQPQAPPQQGGVDPRLVGLVPPGRTPEQQIGLLSRAIASGNLPVEQAKLYQNRIDAITKAVEPTQAEKDFQAGQRNPKLDDYTAQNEAAKASAKGVAESDIKEQNDVIAQGKQAMNRLTTLNTMSNIISSDPNINLGFGGPTALKVKMALESLGVPVPDLSGPQAIQKLNASLASEMAKSLTSRTTQFEFRTFLGNNPGLELDKNGNQRLIGIFSQLAKRDVDLGKLARQSRDNWQNWDQVVENYDKKNPMKDPVTNKALSTDSIVAPGPGKSAAASSTTVSSKADYDKLPAGATFTGPDGKPWRKP